MQGEVNYHRRRIITAEGIEGFFMLIKSVERLVVIVVNDVYF
jgi:hypothetical protein